MKQIYLSKPYIGKEEIKAVNDVMKSGMLASGPKVKMFEEKFAKTIGVKHAIAVSSGTTALHAALLGLGISRGDRVITTPLTFIATANSIRFVEAVPVFVDIDEKTYNLDPVVVEGMLKKDKKIKAILLVHLYGLTCDMDAFRRLAKKYKVKLIEDCAQAVGSKFKNTCAGAFGDAGCYSLYATKNIMTGEGGMVTTNNDAVAAKIRKIINHGRSARFEHDMLGYNFRMMDLSAGIGLAQLARLKKITTARINNAKYLTRGLKDIDYIITPSIPKAYLHVFHQYSILVPKNIRDKFVDYLVEKGIHAAPFYPLSIPEQPCYKKLGYKVLPKAYEISKRVVCLPVHPLLSKTDLDYILKCIRGFKK